MKPKIFVGSSVERQDVALRLQDCLQYDANVTVWSQGLFGLNESTLDQLVRALQDFDFAIFVFAPDDELTIREQTVRAVRDNVVFELGLFMGHLGKQSTFIVAPRASSGVQWLSDLVGFTPAKYDAELYNRNPEAALGPACLQIKDAIYKNYVPIPGVYVMGRYNRLGVGWRPYAGFDGAMDIYTKDAHLHGGPKGGMRYPWTDNLDARCGAALFRIKRDPQDPVRLYLAVRHEGGEESKLHFSTAVRTRAWASDISLTGNQREYSVPIPHTPIDQWFPLRIDVASITMAFTPRIEAITGVRLKAPMRISHIIIAESDDELPKALKDAAVVLA